MRGPLTRFSRFAAAGVCIAALAAACGQSDQEQVRRVVDDYIGAVERADYALACELFTEQYRRELGGEAECRRALADQFGSGGDASPELVIARLGVRGDRANAELRISRDGSPPSPFTLLLAADGDDWLIRGQQ